MATKKNDLLKRPIGVFDSGLGGLTVLKRLLQKMPHEDVIYFGDLARLPYGIKSKKQILEFSSKNVAFLIKKGVKAVIIACNSSSSTAYRSLKRKYQVPIVDVIGPAVEEAIQMTRNRRIGVIGTLATIESKAYTEQIKKKLKSSRVFSASCPLFVPLVEEGWLQNKVTEDVARIYLRPLLKNRIDTLILGCTHYPLLKNTIRKVIGKRVGLVEAVPSTVHRLQEVLNKRGLVKKSGKGKLTFFVTDKGRRFVKIGSRFLGRKLSGVKVVHPI